MDAITNRASREAKINHGRWRYFYVAKEAIATLQHIYAMTSHTSQGSTFANVFMDIPNMRGLEHRKPKEMQQLLYVAVTRASQAVVLIGAPDVPANGSQLEGYR